MLEIQVFRSGLTVAELKRLLADWPEQNEHGEPTEVWVSNAAGSSNQVREIWPLRMQTKEDGSRTADLLLQHDGD